MNVMNFLEELSKRAELIKNEGDYFKDELLYCGVCNEPKQAVKEIPFAENKKLIVTLQCKCQRDEEEKQRLALAEQEHRRKVKYLTQHGLAYPKYKECTFSKDDQRNTDITKLCCNYVRHFPEMREMNNGIMFYGDTDKGKTFYACCIANALIQREVPVLVTTLSNLVQNRVKALTSKGNEISLDDFRCIVLDDIGTENTTQTAFNIIDEIYLSKKLLIVTTNLDPLEMKCADTIERKRIYERILEMCGTKVLVNNDKTRLQSGIEKGKIAESILNS